MVVDLRFFDLRFAIAFGHLLNFVATTPSSSCVARVGSRLSRPLLAAHHHLPTATYIFYTSTRPFPTMARAPSPRKHPRSDDALVVVRCAGGSRLSRPLLAAHHHLPTTTYIFYTSTRPFSTMARAPSPRKHPRSDDALVVVRCTGRVALVATVTRRPPPSTHYHLHLLHFYTAIFHDGGGAPLLRPLARLTSFGGYVATGGRSRQARPSRRAP